MTSEKASKLILLVSLGFAAAIVFLSFFFPNTNDSQMLTFVMITIWLIPFSYLQNVKRKSIENPLSKEEKE